jgi:hypothetical protein
MKETGAPLAGEMSGHIFFKHRWYGFDDALYAAVRLIEAVSASGKSLTEIMDAMPKSVATPELRFPVDEPRKFAIVEEVRERLSADGAKVDATDGVRVSTPDGWWLLRASNTQDVLVARAEAKDEAGVERLVAQIDEQLAKSGVERAEAVHQEMSIVNVLASCPTANSLPQFVRLTSAALDGVGFTRRVSSNYVDGEYFRASFDDVEITIAYSDEIDHQDLAYWAAFKSARDPEPELIGRVDKLIRERLMPAGMKVARLERFGRKDEVRIDY